MLEMFGLWVGVWCQNILKRFKSICDERFGGSSLDLDTGGSLQKAKAGSGAGAFAFRLRNYAKTLYVNDFNVTCDFLSAS